MFFFENTTLLITHYNRSRSLERLLESLKARQLGFAEIIVSDDASKEEHLNLLKALQQVYSFRLLTTPQNGGLANNLNKGLEAVQTPYILYVQEDFIPTELFAPKMRDAIGFMETNENLDFVRFYAYSRYPYLKPYGKGFSEMVYYIWQPDYMKIYAYSDHPHLRRKSFTAKFGKYREGIKSDRAEYLMCLSFMQNKGKGLFYEDYQSLFVQKNSASEPSTVPRSEWKQSNRFFIRFVRDIYRTVKYNFDIIFIKSKTI